MEIVGTTVTENVPNHKPKKSTTAVNQTQVSMVLLCRFLSECVCSAGFFPLPISTPKDMQITYFLLLYSHLGHATFPHVTLLNKQEVQTDGFKADAPTINSLTSSTGALSLTDGHYCLYRSNRVHRVHLYPDLSAVQVSIHVGCDAHIYIITGHFADGCTEVAKHFCCIEMPSNSEFIPLYLYCQVYPIYYFWPCPFKTLFFLHPCDAIWEV